jgi:hypothetical protein
MGGSAEHFRAHEARHAASTRDARPCRGPGHVPPPLLPGVYRLVGRFLPNGATVEAIGNAMYFPRDQHLAPVAVEAAWLTGALVVLVWAARHGRSPSAV